MADQVKCLKGLEIQNGRHKQLTVELSLKNQMLKEVGYGSG
jgi:hypothetical protein